MQIEELVYQVGKLLLEEGEEFCLRHPELLDAYEACRLTPRNQRGQELHWEDDPNSPHGGGWRSDGQMGAPGAKV